MWWSVDILLKVGRSMISKNKKIVYHYNECLDLLDDYVET